MRIPRYKSETMGAFIKTIAHESLRFLYDLTAHYRLYAYFISNDDSLFHLLS
jgi:hypothetical protein